MAASSSRSKLGCACGLLVALALAGLTTLTWITYREAQKVKASFKDPAAREAKTREVLPFRTLPAGYHALGSFSVPLIAKMAFFGDREPNAGEEPNRGMTRFGFIYMNMRKVRNNKAEILRYVKGAATGGDKPKWIEQNADFQAGEAIGRGEVEVGGTEVYYFASRGAMKQPKGDLGGLLTLVVADCKNDESRVRFGIWLGPDPAPGKPVADLDLKGTNADPAALQEFLGHFELCAEGK